MVHGSKVEPKPDDRINFARSCGESQNEACPASQSGTGYGGDAERAVDNSGLNGDYRTDSCTHNPDGTCLIWQWFMHFVLLDGLKCHPCQYRLIALLRCKQLYTCRHELV